MALASYSDLLSAVTNWMARADMSGEAADFITLAEARLNREINAVRLSTTLNGQAGSRTIDISGLSCEHPIALYLAQPGLDEVELTPKSEGTFVHITVAGRPRFWAREGEDGGLIGFDRELDGDYPFRLYFDQSFKLSESAPTNWLLTNHPDLYLAAVLVWGGLFIRDNAQAAQWQAVLNASLPEVKNIIAQSKRANLTVDPALQRVGRNLRGTYNGAWWY